MRLMRSSDIAQRPVVTLDGDDVAQVKDIVYAADGGSVSGFTLAGRGVFAGPLKEGLPWTAVLGLGADAVMIADTDAFQPVDSLPGTSSGGSGVAREHPGLPGAHRRRRRAGHRARRGASPSRGSSSATWSATRSRRRTR